MANQWSIRAVRDNLGGLKSDLAARAQDALEVGGPVMVSTTIANEPERTGHMKATTEGESRQGEYLMKIGATYWPYQNSGTRYIAPKFFVETGLNAGVAEFHREMAKIAMRVK